MAKGDVIILRLFSFVSCFQVFVHGKVFTILHSMIKIDKQGEVMSPAAAGLHGSRAEL